MAPECIILIGLPASGKTTLYRERFEATHLHISKDLWPNAAGRSALQERMIEEALSSRRSVVIDNTNPRRADRAPLIELARRHEAKVIGYFFEISTRVAVARNANRSGRGKVPNVAIFTSAKKLEPPTWAEGYDALLRVTIAEDRSLEISEARIDA